MISMMINPGEKPAKKEKTREKSKRM